MADTQHPDHDAEQGDPGPGTPSGASNIPEGSAHRDPLEDLGDAIMAGDIAPDTEGLPWLDPDDFGNDYRD